MRDFNFQNSLVELLAVGLLSAICGAAIGSIAMEGAIPSSDRATLLSGFGGAVVGAGVSAFISLVLARQSAKETLRRDTELLSREQQGFALKLMVKASFVLSDLVAIRTAIDESLSQANDRNLTALPMWRRVLPIVGGHQVYEIDSTELAPLIEAKAHDLFYDTTTLFMQHRTLVGTVEVYSTKREKMKELVTRHLEVRDGVISSGLTESEASELAPYEVELESLITQVRLRLPELEKLAEKVTFGIGPAIRKQYPDSGFPMFVAKGTAHEGKPV